MPAIEILTPLDNLVSALPSMLRRNGGRQSALVWNEPKAKAAA
jgi:hypothetical protein